MALSIGHFAYDLVHRHLALLTRELGTTWGNLPPIPRLGVPPLKLHDAGNGFRNMPGPQGKAGSTAGCLQAATL